MTDLRTIHRDIVGAFIWSRDGKLVLGKTGVYDGQWVVPGGGIEEGETKLEAVKREILEETGLDISGAKIEAIEKIKTGESEKVLRDTGERVHVQMTLYDYVVTLDKKADEIPLKAEDDFTTAGWFNREQYSKMPLSPPTIEFLKLQNKL